ncbi:MAG: CcdB family protein [Cytophagales bacterium]|nr:CcdB family protein [Cytophagales bacterium]
MAQFDVHQNLSSLRVAIPFVVIVQSSQFDASRSRVVVPLVSKKAMSSSLLKVRAKINPEFVINGQAVVLHPLEMSSIPTHQMGEWVATLEDSGLEITDALDELFTRSWK